MLIFLKCDCIGILNVYTCTHTYMYMHKYEDFKEKTEPKTWSFISKHLLKLTIQ